MAPAVRGRSSLNLALLVIGAGALMFGGVVVVLTVRAGVAVPMWPAVLYVVVGLEYVGAGLVAWSRRPANHTGLLIVLAGFAVLVSSLQNTGDEVLFAVGMIFATLLLAVIVHLLHAFPSGRLRGRASKVVVASVYFVSLVLQAPLYLFTDFPGNILAISNRPDVASTAYDVQTYAGAVVMFLTSVILYRRLQRADSRQRRILAPVYVYGIFAVLFIPVSVRVLMPSFDITSESIAAMQLLVLSGIPLAFTVGVLSGGFARSGDIEELGAWLSHASDARNRLTPVLAHTLGDESLEMLFWDADRGGYNDPAGAPAWLPAPGSGRAYVEFDVEGRRVGAIVYDGLLIGDAQPVRAAGRVAAITLAHERLAAQLRASEEEIRQSRIRIVEAGDRERRRIARNLHDGLQVQLVLLAMHASEVAKDPTASTTTREAATALRAGIDKAAGDLRTLVHEVMPAALIERGLSAATEDLIDRVPLRTKLDLNLVGHKLTAAVESTAYFVVAEGITNTLKHASAKGVDVRMEIDSDRLVVEVSDDGQGGAAPGGGSGLLGLADRVDTLGGRMHVLSPEGAGTRLLVELPCGS